MNRRDRRRSVTPHSPPRIQPTISSNSERDSQMRLTLARPIRCPDTLLTIDHLSEVRVVEVESWSAEDHPVQHVEVFDLELEFHALANGEVLGQGDVLVEIPGIPQLTDDTWRIPEHPWTGVAEISRVNHRLA